MKIGRTPRKKTDQVESKAESREGRTNVRAQLNRHIKFEPRVIDGIPVRRCPPVSGETESKA